MRGVSMRSAVAVWLLTLVAPLQAQSTSGAPGVVTSWTPFYGCWSTSSSGRIGPMVCVVPGATRAQVEFMTVDGDSVIGRTMVDASGKRVPALRTGCTGWEQGTWASDGQRLLMHAEYRCTKRPVQRSDAVLSLSHTDAFTQVERNLSDWRAPARVVNFIVQLDTTLFPVEVRRRLPHLRPLALETAELETLPDIASGVIVEAASQGRELPEPFGRDARGAVRRGLGRFGAVGVFSLSLPVYLTADHGNMPEPIGGVWAYWNLSGFDPTRTIGVPFGWP